MKTGRYSQKSLMSCSNDGLSRDVHICPNVCWLGALNVPILLKNCDEKQSLLYVAVSKAENT